MIIEKIDSILRQNSKLQVKKKFSFSFFILFNLATIILTSLSIFIHLNLLLVSIFYFIMAIIYIVVYLNLDDINSDNQIDFLMNDFLCYKNINEIENNIQELKSKNLIYKYSHIIENFFTEEDLFYFLIGYDKSFPNIKTFIVESIFLSRKQKNKLVNYRTEIFIKAKYNIEVYPYILNYLKLNDPENIYLEYLKDFNET